MLLLYLFGHFLFKVVVQFSVFSVTCKAGEEIFRLPNGEIADSVSTARYMDEQLAIRTSIYGQEIHTRWLGTSGSKFWKNFW